MEGSPQNNAYAVIIGVEEYRDLPAPTGAASDAKRFHKLPARGRVYFYFAGHGAPESTKDTTFLMPFDGDAKDPVGTALSMKAVMQSLSETKAENVLAVVDACFTGDSGSKATRSVSR